MGVTIREDLSWGDKTSVVVSKAQQRLYFLRRLRRVNLSQKMLENFYRCTGEKILTNCMTVWYRSCTKAAKKTL